MNTSPAHTGQASNVIDLFSRRVHEDPQARSFVRMTPELDGLAMVYSHPSDQTTLFALRLIGWAMQKNGEVVGVVPWLKEVIAADSAADPRGGQWQGYYDYETETVFSDPPEHKVAELKAAMDIYEFVGGPERYLMQEMPDLTGTHLVTLKEDQRSFQMAEVFSWGLFSDGTIEAFIVDESKVINTPVLPGDDSLFPASQVKGTSYYFQYQIANQIKRREPEAMQALVRMMHSAEISSRSN
ncbi:hypothetical protein [Oceanospirillum beijerinckii]|uniref:hypothetical protein n=1 Tax=Oceanospirillum beijerinckii TaxID=64976 RepID=UPI000417C13D|nr:hypothetical protein [Oceanospirillum beijerinckii]